MLSDEVKGLAFEILSEAIDCHIAELPRGALHGAYDAVNCILDRGFRMASLRDKGGKRYTFAKKVGSLCGEDLIPALAPLSDALNTLGELRRNMAHVVNEGAPEKSGFQRPDLDASGRSIATAILLFDALDIAVPGEDDEDENETPSLDLLPTASRSALLGPSVRFTHPLVSEIALEEEPLHSLSLKVFVPRGWTRKNSASVMFTGPWARVTFLKGKPAEAEFDRISNELVDVLEGPVPREGDGWQGVAFFYREKFSARPSYGILTVTDALGGELVAVEVACRSVGLRAFRPMFDDLSTRFRSMEGH